MKLSTFKEHLTKASELNFSKSDGAKVPSHFHITEAGLTTKHFIDCGGTVRVEKNVSFQIWVSTDTGRRLEPRKLERIISLAENLFKNEDPEVEFEYQQETIGRYGVEIAGNTFILTSKQTDCLAKENCGIPQDKIKVTLSSLTASESCCTPGGGCC